MRCLACLTLAALVMAPGRSHLWASPREINSDPLPSAVPASPISRGKETAVAQPILIGLLLPPEETEAASLRRGVQLGVDHANQSPGTKVTWLVRGRVGQWGADGEEAGRMVLDDAVRGLIAPPGGAPSHLALQIAGRTATPVFSLCPDSSVVGAGIPWMVRMVPGTRDEARLLFATFRTNAAGRSFRWAALVPTERAGREVTSDLRHAASPHGIGTNLCCGTPAQTIPRGSPREIGLSGTALGSGSEFISRGKAASSLLDQPVEVSPQQTDFSQTVRQILSAGPDGILIWLDAKRAGELAKSLRAAGFSGQLAGPGRLQAAAFTAPAGSAVEGCVLAGTALDAASQAVAARFAAAHRQQFGEEPDATTRVAYDATLLLAGLLRKSSNAPPRHAFPITGEQPGASGRLKFDTNGNRLVPLHLLQFRNGGFTPFAGHDSPP